MGIFRFIFGNVGKKETLQSEPTRQDVFKALERLMHLELAAEASVSYPKAIAKQAKAIEVERRTLEKYARGLQPMALKEMQAEYYSFTNSDIFRMSGISHSAVRVHLTSAWHEIGPWRK